MATAISFNPFPKGHTGGVVFHSGAASDPLVGLMMPPVKETEILLHVEGLPSRCVFDTKGDRILFSYWQGQYRMHIMSKDSAGANVISPFLFANVWEDSKICWGAKNLAPTTFNSAWEFYWTAPFNNHLVPRPKVEVEFSEWKDRPEARAFKTTNIRLRKIVERLLSKIGGDGHRLKDPGCPDPSKWPVNKNVALAKARLSRLNAYYERIRVTAEEIKRRQKEECASRGKQWVAINHDSYMKALKIKESIGEKITATMASMKDHIHHTVMRDNIASYARDIAYFVRLSRFYPVSVCTEENRGIMRQRTRLHTNAWRARTRNNNRSYLRDVLRSIRGSFDVQWKDIIHYIRARILYEFELMLNESESTQLGVRYREWCEQQNEGHYHRHFFEDGWRKCLEFKRVDEWSKTWTNRHAFTTECDGEAMIPDLLYRGQPVDAAIKSLPYETGEFVIPYLQGKYVGRLRSPTCLYKNINERVKYLFMPGTTFAALTDGTNIIPTTDDTFDDDVAHMMSTDPDCQPLDVLFNRAGYPLGTWRYIN